MNSSLIVAYYEVLQIKRDIVKAPEGRSIGDVHDKSAPTEIPYIL